MNNKIRTRFRWISLVVFMLFMGTTLGLYVYYNIYSRTLLSNTKKSFNEIVINRTLKINSYIDARITAIQELITSQQIQQIFADKNKAKDVQLNTFVTSYLAKHKLENIILTDPIGSVIYSNKESDKFLDINLAESPYAETQLGKFFDKSKITLTTSITYLSYDYILGVPTDYIIIPVFEAKKLKGFIAAEINSNDIFAITNNYFGLGVTGEVVLGYSVEDGAQIISSLRNDPDSALNRIDYFLGRDFTPIQKAVLGQEGLGISYDYRGVEVVSAWGFVPSLGWGMVVKMDMDEVMSPVNMLRIILYILCILTFVFFIACCIAWKKNMLAFAAFNKKIYTGLVWLLRMRTVLAIGFILGLCSIVFFLWQYNNLSRQAVEKTHSLAQAKIRDAAYTINQELKNVQLRAQSIADDLSAGRLKKEDIVLRMQRDLAENSVLSGIAIAYEPYLYDSNRKLYAPYVIKNQDNSLDTKFIDSLYDYTAKDHATDWYHTALSKGTATWFEPQKNEFKDNLVARYTVPFFKYDANQNNKNKNPIGIVMVDYNINRLRVIAHKLVIGETGYAFVIDQNGTFIYSPNSKTIEERQTIFDLAQEQVNQGLYDASKRIVQSSSGLESYVDPSSHRTVWIHFDDIPALKWSLGVVFFEQEVSLPRDVIRHMLIWILVSCVITVILFLMLFFNVSVKDLYSLKKLAISSSVIFFLALITLFFIIQGTLEYRGNKDEVVISSEVTLQAYLSDRRKKANVRYDKLITIPTGILIDSMTFPDSEHVGFTGRIWQKYPKDNKEIERGFYIPGATELTLEKEFQKIENNEELIAWKIKGKLYQDYAFSKYPFDQHKIEISIVPKGNNSTVIFVPELESYKKNDEFIGIAKKISLPEFSVEKTFFSFLTIPQEVTLSNKNNEVYTSTNLQFNIVIYRRVIDAFIMYFIPLMVILFSLFAIFVKTAVADIIKAGISRYITAYSSLLFALIVLHANLRGSYKESSFLYIEYLFFLSYITILLFIIQILFISKQKNIQDFLEKLTALIKLFFWPIQFACWFIATIIVFYN